jgi:hypothetical protein
MLNNPERGCLKINLSSNSTGKSFNIFLKEAEFLSKYFFSSSKVIVSGTLLTCLGALNFKGNLLKINLQSIFGNSKKSPI